jgi:hypothetical protein
VDDISTHLVFLLVSGGALLFLLLMRWRLVTRYPEDQSRQMQSMLGFVRAMAVFAAMVGALVLVNLARIVLWA